MTFPAIGICDKVLAQMLARIHIAIKYNMGSGKAC